MRGNKGERAHCSFDASALESKQNTLQRATYKSSGQYDYISSGYKVMNEYEWPGRCI